MMKHCINLVLIISLFACNRVDNVLFQDSFEEYKNGELISEYWKVSGKGKVVIDTSFAYSGKQSLSFMSGEGYANRAFASLTHLFPIDGNKYYGAMKMYIKGASPDGIHWTMIQSGGAVKGKNFRSEIRYGGQHQKRLMANYDTQEGVKSDCWQHSNIPIPEGRWFEITWMFDGGHNEMQLWLDGQLIQELIVKGKGEGCVSDGTNGNWIFPEMENVTIGWVDYQTGGGQREVWIDDVIINLTPIHLYQR